MKKNNLTRTASMRLTEQMYREIKDYCWENRITLSELVRVVLEKLNKSK